MRSLVQVQDGPYLYVGGIAQLVERLLCKQDVSGSSPLTSTEYHLLHIVKGENYFEACPKFALRESSFLFYPINKMLDSLNFIHCFSENLDNCIDYF